MSATADTVITAKSRLATATRQVFIAAAVVSLGWSAISGSHQPLTALGMQRWEQVRLERQQESQQKAQREAQAGESRTTSEPEHLGIVEYFARGFWLLLTVAPVYFYAMAVLSAAICGPFVILASLFNWLEGYHTAWISWSALVILTCVLYRCIYFEHFWIVWPHLVGLPAIAVYVYVQVLEKG